MNIGNTRVDEDFIFGKYEVGEVSLSICGKYVGSMGCDWYVES